MSDADRNGEAPPERAVLAVRESRAPTLGDFLRAAPVIARTAANASFKGAARAAGVYVEIASGAVKAASNGEPPAQIVQEATTELRAYARSLLGLPERGGVQAAASRWPSFGGARVEESGVDSLRRHGAELLRRSADIRFDEPFHPAYRRILDALAPDEARILRFLAQHGAQPAIDVRAGLPLVSELIEPGCNMIGAEAGCRHLDRVHAYLDNLHRLGLIWFSREPVKDPRRYQVLEAQPEVVDARARGGRTSRAVRRSILLTPFGEDFCAVCMPIEELEPLPPVAEDDAAV